MNSNYASYEKVIIGTITRIKHIVRIGLNESRDDIINTLKKVPHNAKVLEIIGDAEDEEMKNYGEIIFEEEREK